MPFVELSRHSDNVLPTEGAPERSQSQLHPHHGSLRACHSGTLSLDEDRVHPAYPSTQSSIRFSVKTPPDPPDRRSLLCTVPRSAQRPFARRDLALPDDSL